MKVYTVRAVGEGSDKFRSLMHDSSKGEFNPVVLDGTPRAAGWVRPPVYVYRPRMKYGDFWHYWIGSTTIAVAPRSVELVKSVLAPEDELLPLDVEGETFQLINVVGLIDCFDDANSVWADPEWKLEVVNYAFYPEKIARSLFRLGEFKASRLFAADITRDPANEFKAMVEANKLTGIYFDEVWSDES